MSRQRKQNASFGDNTIKGFGALLVIVVTIVAIMLGLDAVITFFGFSAYFTCHLQAFFSGEGSVGYTIAMCSAFVGVVLLVLTRGGSVIGWELLIITGIVLLGIPWIIEWLGSSCG